MVEDIDDLVWLLQLSRVVIDDLDNAGPVSGNLILRNASSGSAQNGASERGGKQVQALQRNSQLFIWKKTNSLGSQPNRTLHDFR